MEKREIDVACGKIRNGKKVVQNVLVLSEWISSLNFQIYHAQEHKTLEQSVINILKKDLRYAENELEQALKKFIDESNPRPISKSKMVNRKKVC